jgi:hypothetical protein
MPLLSAEVAVDAYPALPGPELEQGEQEEFAGPVPLMAALRANDAELVDESLRTGRVRCVNAPDKKTGKAPSFRIMTVM